MEGIVQVEHCKTLDTDLLHNCFQFGF